MCIEYIVQGQSLTLLFPYICTVWNQSPADQQFESGTQSLLYYCIDFYSRKELILLYTTLILLYIIICNYVQYVLILLYTKLILFSIIMCNYIQYVLILLCTKELILLYY